MLDERDEDIKLKQSVHSYLEAASKYFNEAFPLVIDVFRNGLENIKPEQVEGFKKHMEQGKVFLDETDEVENKFDTFLKQHNLTMDELNQRGVKTPADTIKNIK